MKVQSECLAHVDVEKTGRGKVNLSVQFHDGSAYSYFNVPKRTVTAMLNSGSIGGYYNRRIRGQFEEGAQILSKQR